MQIKKVFGDHLPIIMMMKPGMFVRYIARHDHCRYVGVGPNTPRPKPYPNQ